MGPAGAVLTAFWLVVYGLTGVGWVTASPKALGVIAVVVAIVIVVELFWGSPLRTKMVRRRRVVEG
jgi:amino acid permease